MVRRKKVIKKIMIEKFAEAIKNFEGWFPYSRSYKNNNPGNLKFTDYTKSLGAVGADIGGFCLFDNYSTGFEALCQFIRDAALNKLKNYKDVTILGFFKVYAPSSDRNSPQHYAQFVAEKVGLKIDTPLKNLL